MTTKPNNKYLAIGINGYGNGAALNGCIPDMRAGIEWAVGCGWHWSQLRSLSDENRPTAPTRLGIWRRLEWLLNDAKPGDKRILSFSGHGAQIPTRHSGEVDGLEEALCPINFDADYSDTWIIDDDIMELLSNVQEGVDCTVILDACFSGGMYDRSTALATNGSGRLHKRVSRAYPLQTSMDYMIRIETVTERGIKPTKLIRAEEAPHVCFMLGCREDQTCAEKYFSSGGFRGAWSKYLFDALTTYPQLSRRENANLAVEQLASNGFNQIPQIIGPDELLLKPLG